MSVVICQLSTVLGTPGMWVPKSAEAEANCSRWPEPTVETAWDPHVASASQVSSLAYEGAPLMSWETAQ